MMRSVHEDVLADAGESPRLGREDPLLQELWRIKAALNAEAEFSVERLAERAAGFDLDVAIASLRRELAH